MLFAPPADDEHHHFVLLIPLLALSFLPKEILASFDSFLVGPSPPQIMAGMIFILLIFDPGLLAYALSQFRRAKLITD